MRAFQASAGVFSRLASAFLLSVVVSACGDNTGPPADGEAAGLWNATVQYTGMLPGGGNVTCTVDWVMNIQEFGEGSSDLYTMVPFTPEVSCSSGFTAPWQYRTWSFIVRQVGSSVVFLSTARLDTFAVASFNGGTMSGRIGEDFYESGVFHATRRGGADPNLQPGIFAIGSAYPDLELGDTMRIYAQVADSYGRTIDTATVTWSSSATQFATVDPDGLIFGVSPGTTRIVGELAGLRDSFTVVVLPPAASVAITEAPDSTIVPGSYQLSAVAMDAGGQPLYERRLTWESSNAAVAAVDAGGVLQTVAPGSVTITAHSRAVSASVTIPVLPAVAQISLASAGTAVPIGGSLQITATTLDAQGHVLTGRPVSWQTGDGTIISVDQDGLTHGVRAGAIQLGATAENASATLDLRSEMDSPLASVAAGDSHSCGVATSGRAYCWGQNTVGQLGSGLADGGSALLVPSAQHFTSLTSRGSHTCALSQTGAAFCWGYNSFGQLGAAGGVTGAVETVAGGLTFAHLTAGFEFTCGLTPGGSAYCWGLNGAGQLGRGTNDLLAHSAPAAVVGGHTFTSIAAGDNTACGLTSAGAAWCWGSNQFGNLGLGTQDTDPHSTPVHAAPALTFSVIAPGLTGTCGITTAGVVYCWGEGQLTPAPFDATIGYTDLAAGQASFCRVDGAGAVSCWGDVDLSHVPEEPAAGVVVGSRHACARLVATGKVECWGQDDWRQLGGDGFSAPGPVEVMGQP